MRIKIRNKRMIYIIIIIVLVISAVYFLFFRDYQKPQEMVEKVLKMKETTSLKDNKLGRYFSKDYLSRPKQAEGPYQIAVHTLKTRQQSKSKVVTMSVTLADANGPYEVPVLDFYLEKKGNIFNRHWQITDVVELDSSLARSAKDILVKKEEKQVDLNNAFTIANGPEVKVKGFKIPERRSRPQDEEKDISTDYTFNLSWNPTNEDNNLFISVEDDKNQQCSEIKKVSLKDFQEKETTVKLSDYRICDKPTKIRIFSLSQFDYMVKL